MIRREGPTSSKSGRGRRGLHDDVEQLVTFSSDILTEGSDQPHGLQSGPIDPIDGGRGALERCGESLIYPGDLSAALMTITGRFRFIP